MKSILPFVFAALAAPVSAQGFGDVFDLSIRSGWRQADGTHIAGVEVTLAPGWKTYWRQPGDAGIPPHFDWSAAENIESTKVLWPAPKVFWTLGLRSIGYESHVVFPLVVTPKDDGPVALRGQIQLGVCEEICIPVNVTINAVLPAKGGFDADIGDAMKAQLQSGPGHVTCNFTPTSDSMKLTLGIPKSGVAMPEVVVETSDPSLWVSQPKVAEGGPIWAATTEFLSPSGTPTAVSRSDLRTTVFYGDRAVEYRGCTAG